LRDGIEIGVGARNLFDDDYILTDGFPEPGRSFSVRAIGGNPFCVAAL